MHSIATLVLLAKPKTDPEFTLTVEIGTPYYVGSPHEGWACPCSLRPLYGRLVDAQGSDALQALCLSISLIQQLLRAFLDDGGTLKTEDGADINLDSYSFGAAADRAARQ